jgi:hypothetical protein
MLGYIVSDDEKINIKNHKIYSFDVLCNKNFNIFIADDDKILYVNNIIINAMKYKHIQVIEWYKKSGLEFNYNVLKNKGYQYEFYYMNPYKYYCDGIIKIRFYVINKDIEFLKSHKKLGFKILFKYYAVENACYYENIKALNFFIFISNIKKIIKISNTKYKIISQLKFKTKNKYLKGYNKN